MKNNKENKNNLLQITQIKIKLSDSKEIELTSDEARKVYKELQSLFSLEKENTTLEQAAKDLEKILELQKQSPAYIPYPIYIEKYPNWNPPPWEITCGTDDSKNKYYFGDPPGSCQSLAGNLPNGGTITNGGLKNSVLSINLVNKT